MPSAPVYQSHSEINRFGHQLYRPASPSPLQHQIQPSPTPSQQTMSIILSRSPSSGSTPPHSQPQESFSAPHSHSEEHGPSHLQPQFQQPQFEIVSEYNLADSTSQVDVASSTRLDHQPQQEHQMHYSQSPGSHHSRQNSAAGEQLHTLSGSPITPTSTSLDATPHHTYNNTHGKFKTSTPSVVTADYTKAKLFRRRVMRQVTVPRLQILWGLLALFGTMAWLSMMPAYAFRNKPEPPPPVNGAYTNFLIATVGTSIAALWQSLCPFLIRYSKRQLIPQIISHPITQSITIILSIIFTLLNFFSWIVLAADKQGGAKANCREGPLADQSGYTAQCRGVNVAIVLDVIVFLLWLPIGAVIVCGTIERGFWWWRADGWAIHQKNQQNTAITTKTITPKKGDKTMSEEEFDLKIGVNSNKNRSHGGGLGGSQDRLSYYADEEEEAMESRPAFVTPIASKFRTSTTDDESRGQDTEHHHIGQVAPSGYRQHHQQHQQQQRQQSQDQIQVIPRSGGVGGRGGRLVRKGSNNSMTPSISARLSAFFGQGWNSGPMPPPPPSEPAQPAPPVPAHHRPLRFEPSSSKDADRESQADKGSAHGDAYTTQWHNRRYDEWS